MKNKWLVFLTFSLLCSCNTTNLSSTSLNDNSISINEESSTTIEESSSVVESSLSQEESIIDSSCEIVDYDFTILYMEDQNEHILSIYEKSLIWLLLGVPIENAKVGDVLSYSGPEFTVYDTIPYVSHLGAIYLKLIDKQKENQFVVQFVEFNSSKIDAYIEQYYYDKDTDLSIILENQANKKSCLASDYDYIKNIETALHGDYEKEPISGLLTESVTFYNTVPFSK